MGSRQYCGRLGNQLPRRKLPGLCQPFTGNKGLYLPEPVGPRTKTGVGGGVPEDRQDYRSKKELALEMVGRATSGAT